MQGDGVLARLDDALIRLRRFWLVPSGARRAGSGAAAPELSTVLVVDAINRQQQEPAAPVRVADVAHRLDVTPSTASRLVDRAVRAGMVDRASDRADPRRAVLTLTSDGAGLVVTAFGFRTGYLKQVLAGWTAADVETFTGLLDRFAAAVHTHGLPTERTP